jgi:putative phosphoesterase
VQAEGLDRVAGSGQPIEDLRVVDLWPGCTSSAPGRIRTCGLSLRRRALYPLSYGRLAKELSLTGVKRLAVISDTHLPRRSRALPDACLEQLRRADAILHAGDLMELSVLEELQALGPPVHAVRGNVDSAELQARLPLTRVVEVDGARIAMVHDAGPREGRLGRLRRRFPDVHAVVFGHSHIPLHEERDGFVIFNPGSPTERRRSPRHTMGIATVDGGRVRFELLNLD